MTIESLSGEARRDRAVLNSFGADLMKYIEDDTITEIYINTDYYVWIETFTGRQKTDLQLAPEKVRSICESIAGRNNELITEDKPLLGVELASLKIRVQMVYNPVSKKPIFMLRKKATRIFTLEEYVEAGVLSESYYDVLVDLILHRKNIVVAGSTGSGKTTFLNALLHKLYELTPDHRLLILEDLPELQCSSPDVLHLMVSGNKALNVDMQDLVYVSLRLSPERIIVGEVRNQSAYDMLKAWNTGHEGGFCTLHANSCESAFLRLEQLVRESDQVNSAESAQYLIGESVDAIVSIQKKVTPEGTSRKIDDIVLVEGCKHVILTDIYKFSHI